MKMDVDGFIQMMDMMFAMNSGVNTPEQRRKRAILTVLKLMQTKKFMESYEKHYAKGDCLDRNLYLLTALRPHMTDERQQRTDILIKLLELKQILGNPRIGADTHGY